MTVLNDLCCMATYFAYALILMVLWMGCNPIARYKYRHIPGPFGWPFIGNLLSVITIQQHTYFMQLRKKHGPIFVVWYGSSPWVVICEPDSIRKVAYKFNNRFMLPHSLQGEPQYMLEHSLLMLKSDTWRLLKKAWDPATLHRSSLEGYAPLMHEAGQQLVERLRGVQQRGEVVDIWAEISKMTLEVVGTCAFGVKFSGSDPADGWGKTGEQLLGACKAFFTSQELDKGSKWVLPVLALPPLAPLIRRLACLLPDEGQRMSAQSQLDMAEGARKIIAASRTQRKRGEQEAEAAKGGVAAAPEGEKRGGRGVLPGSFAAQLEAWKSKYEGEKEVSDDLVVSQVIGFLLAGYETSANAMAFLIYFLSTHPEAQAKLQQEVDNVLEGRAPILDDIPKLPYMDACIKEALRLRGPAVLLARQTDQHMDLLGKAIPLGSEVVMFTYGMHQDPAYWERPEEYLPERFLPETGGKLGPFNENAYLPFGAGGRKCTGYKFAEQEMALVVACLFQAFTFTRPAGEGPLRAKTGMTHSPLGGVKVLVGGRG